MPESPLHLLLTLDRHTVSAETRTTLDLLVEVRADASPSSDRAPIAVALALDVSASMTGAPIAQVIEATRRIIELARPQDELAIVTFADDAQVLVPLARMTQAHRDACTRALLQVALRSATNIEAGLTTAARTLVSASREATASVILLSDGEPNVGVRTASALGATAADLRRRCSVTTLGFGPRHDDRVLAAIAESGGGTYRFIPDPATCSLELTQAFGSRADVVARDVALHFHPAAGVKVRALSPRPTPTSVERLRLPDLFAAEGRLVVAELEVEPRALGAMAALVRVELHATLAGTVEPQVRAATAHVEVSATAAPPRPQVIRRALQVNAADARSEARQRADGGDFAAAAHVITAMIQRIQAAPGLADDQALCDALDQLMDDAALYTKRPDDRAYAAFRRGQRGDLAAVDARASARAPRSAQARAVQLALAGVTRDALFVLPDGSRVPLPVDGVIGRSATCDVVVRSSQVSRQHAHVFALEGDFWVSDLGSANTVHINGVRHPEPHKLVNGDVVLVGDQALRFTVGVDP